MNSSFRLGLLTSTALAAAMAAAVPHAAAVTPGDARTATATATVTFPDARHVEGCHPYTFDYAVQPEPTSPSTWTLSIKGDTSDGGGYFLTSFSSSTTFPLPPTGQQSVTLCGARHLQGTYTVSATLLYRDATGASVVEPQPSATFSIVQPVADTRLKVRRARHGKVITRVSSIVPAYPGGEASANDGADVKVQYRHRKLWVTLRGAKGETNNRGQVRFRTRLPRSATTFRAIVADQLYVDGETSRVARLR